MQNEPTCQYGMHRYNHPASMPGEFDFISWIRAQSPNHPRVLLPQGDDLAVLKWDTSDLLIIGVDQVLDTVHFDSSIHPPREIGRKVMNRNLSDCAAMACLPAGAVTTAALPKGTPLDYAKEVYLGMKDAGGKFDCPIVGGDTATWEGKLVLTLTILARSAGVEPVTRRGAKVGDSIFVTGPLGGSLLGRHMNFVPRIHEARAIAAAGVSAMIDISDGLSRDLRHICEQSGVGAILDAASIPIHEDAVTMSGRDGLPPLEHALHDGEDHELLFTSSVGHPSYVRIGRIVSEPGVFIEAGDKREPLEPRGWQHTF